MWPVAARLGRDGLELAEYMRGAIVLPEDGPGHMTSLFNTPELFESLRNVSHHKAITDDHRDQLIKYGFVRQVFGGGLMLTGDGLEQLQILTRYRV